MTIITIKGSKMTPVDISDEAVQAYAKGLNDKTEAFIDLGRYSTILLTLRERLTIAEREIEVRREYMSGPDFAARDATIAKLREALVEARDEHNYTITWIGAGAMPHQHTAMMDRCDRTIARIDAALNTSEKK